MESTIIFDNKTISLGNVEATIEEIGGIRKFRILYEDSQILNYQKNILEKGLCEGLLKMYFLKLEEKEWVYYDFSGYVQLTNIFNLWREQGRCVVQEIILIILDIVRYLLSCENYLLPLQTFSLNPNTVFVNPFNNEVRLAYIPGNSYSNTVQDCVLELIATTEILSDDEQWDIYGEDIRNEIQVGNYGLDGILDCLNRKSKEIYFNKWPDKNIFRELFSEEKEEEREEGKREKKLKISWPFRLFEES